MKATILALASLLLVASIASAPLSFPVSDDISSNINDDVTPELDDGLFDDDLTADENEDIVITPSPPPIPKSTKPSSTTNRKPDPPKPIYVPWMAMNGGICANPKGCPTYRVPPKCDNICKYKVFQDFTKERWYNVVKPCSDCMLDERCKTRCQPTNTVIDCNNCKNTRQF